MRILVIGQLSGQMSAAIRIARNNGAKAALMEDIHQAFNALVAGNGADLLLVETTHDIALLIQMLKAERITIDVVACGINTDPDQAAAAIRAGAKEFIPLPPDEEMIAAVLASIAEEPSSVIHQSDIMKQTLALANQIAPSDASVLITGESGTGKEVFARYIHAKSSRSKAAFISVNCAAIPDNLLESELFGHEKGSFTGAMHRRIGKFEEADGGTLLLDEISEMDHKLQAKLLRAIQEQEIDRLGGSKPIKINIRILATSNRNLIDSVQKGEFREDLYFRLNVINVALPALRERPEDIALLAKYFIEKFSASNHVPVKSLTKEAEQKMRSYSWPGNVRELENIMHRAVLLARGDAIDEAAIMLPTQSTKKDVPLHAPSVMATVAPPAPYTPYTSSYAPPVSSPPPYGDNIGQLVGRKLEDVEKDMIIKTLDHCLGNRTHAANILGISIRTLRNKLRQYGADMGEDD